MVGVHVCRMGAWNSAPLIGRLFTVALGNILDLKSLAVAFSSARPAGRIYHRLSFKKQFSIRSEAFSLTDATAEFTDEYDRVARDKGAAHLGQANAIYASSPVTYHQFF